MRELKSNDHTSLRRHGEFKKNPWWLYTQLKSCWTGTKFSVWVNDLLFYQTVASTATFESWVVRVLSWPQVHVHPIGTAREEKLNKSSLCNTGEHNVLLFISFLSASLKSSYKRLWSLNSLLAGKQAQIHYNTLFTAGFSQIFVALNYGIHVFESFSGGEGLNGLCIVHWCRSVKKSILI